MLTREDNEILTRVGAGTLMGNLLRRYWLPACLSCEIPEPDCPPVRVRLLGEDLVAFRDTRGQVGLLEEHCPHRGASLFFGRNEECGLRCVYHGWKFDTTGQCIDQRSERQSFASRIQTTAYPVHESGGILWAYLGPPATMTPFRDAGTDALGPEQWTANKETVDCNWVQSMDGDVDTAHISNLHQYNAIDDLPDDGTDRPGYPSHFMSMKLWRHDPKPLIQLEETWYGFRYAGIRETPNGHRHARITAFLFPSTTMIGFVPFTTRQIAVVPADDEHTYRYNFDTLPPEQRPDLGGPAFFNAPGYPFQMLPPKGVVRRTHRIENDYQIDREAQRRATYTGISDFRSHDMMATETAGRIFDRTREHLGSGDRALVKMHKLLIDAAKGLAAGSEPPALAGAGDFRSIHGAEKILGPDEDWRLLGTNDDPTVQQVLGSAVLSATRSS